jgi:hypothetical protein
MTPGTAWLSVRRKVLLILLASALGLLYGCASTGDITYKLYPTGLSNDPYLVNIERQVMPDLGPTGIACITLL